MTAEAGQIAKKRNASLDVIRTIAVLLVVLNHAAEAIFPFSETDAMASQGTGMLTFGYAAETLGRIGVPLFLLLSGYLLLSRDFFQTKNGVLAFYKKNLLPLLLTWEIWVLLYNIVIAITTKTSFSISAYLLQAVFLKQVPLSHAWYVPRILGIYLFIPFLAKILSLMKGRWILLLLGISWAFFFLVPVFGLEGAKLGGVLDLSFSGGVCGFYVVCGYCVFRCEKKLDRILDRRRNAVLLFIAALILFAASALFHFVMLNKGIEFRIWYDFPTMPFVGTAAFLLLKRIRPASPLQPAFLELSVCSFGIYLVHKLILELLKRYLPAFHPAAETIVLTVLAFAGSFLVVTLIGRIGAGRVGKILFLRKKPSKTMKY